MLQVDIEAIDVSYDWGYNSVRPLAGALPDDFAETRTIHIVLDRAKKAWRRGGARDRLAPSVVGRIGRARTRR